MIVAVRRMAVVLAALAVVLGLLPGIVVADGLPAPRDGVTEGPSGEAVRAVAEAHGLACTASQGGGGEAEAFCVRGQGGDLTLAATFYTEPALVLEATAVGTSPLPDETAAFLTELSTLYCTAGRDAMTAYVGDAIRSGSRVETYDHTDARCELHLRVTLSADASPPFASDQLLAYALEPAGSGATGPGPTSPGTAGRAFADAVATPSQVSRDPLVLLESALLAAAIVFLMPFPGQLFNATLEEHEDEVRRWFRLDRDRGAAGRVGTFWASWPGVVAFTVAAALLYGFLDPTFGLDTRSAATFLGMLVGIALVTLAFAVPSWLWHRRRGDPALLKVVPISLVVGVVCVLLSRLTGFQPGYLYGLLIGLAFARELSAVEEGRATAVAAGLMLGVAVVAWIALAALPAAGTSFGLTAMRTALAALMVAGLEGVVFGLMPFRFLPGETLFRWSRVAWGVLLGIGAFAFLHILVNPASGYLSDTSRTPLLTVVALFVGFSLVSVAFWAWFRFRPARSTPSSVEDLR